MSDVRDVQDSYPPVIPEETQARDTSWWDDRTMKGASRSTGSSGSGGSGSGDKWAYRDRRYRHEQNGAGRATFVLVGLALMQTGEAASTVAILAPLGSGSALLVMAKLFLFSSTVKVVNKVSEDAEYLTASAIDAADQAISWTLWLYQIVMSIFCLVMLLGSYKWVSSSWVDHSVDRGSRQPAAVPSGIALDSARLFAQHCAWLSEAKVSALPEILMALCA